jgi:ATP-dependent Clp protease ATP-binding subunit ClpA
VHGPWQRLIQDTIRSAPWPTNCCSVSLADGGRLTVDLDDTDPSKTEVLLDIQPLPEKKGRSKPEEATAG